MVRRDIKLTIWCAVFLALIILAAAYALMCGVWNRSLERRLDQIRASGDPAVPADLVPKPIPESENAAVIYQKAFELPFIEASGIGSRRAGIPGAWEMHRESQAIESFVSDRTKPEERLKLLPEVRKAVDRRAALFHLVEEAVKRPKCQFPVHWEKGPEALYPHLSLLSEIERIIAARAIVRAQDGQMDAALDDVILGLRVARAVAKDPNLISQSIRYSHIRTALGGLKECVRLEPLSNKQARQVYDELSAISINEDFIRAMKGERAITMCLFDQARRRPQDFRFLFGSDTGEAIGPIRQSELQIEAYFYRPLSYKDQEICLDYWSRQLRVLRLPYREIKQSKSLSKVDPYLDAPRLAVFTRGLFPIFVGSASSRDSAAARIGLAQVVMALKAYKSAFDSYPASLAELKSRLGWKLPDDPFSGKPFVYKRRGEGFLLYSIGANLKDDGGVPFLSYKVYEGDISWTAER